MISNVINIIIMYIVIMKFLFISSIGNKVYTNDNNEFIYFNIIS